MVTNGANPRWQTPVGRCLAAATVLCAASLVGSATEQVSAGTGGMSQGCALANSGELNGFVLSGSVSVEFFQGETLSVRADTPANGHADVHAAAELRGHPGHRGVPSHARVHVPVDGDVRLALASLPERRPSDVHPDVHRGTADHDADDDDHRAVDDDDHHVADHHDVDDVDDVDLVGDDHDRGDDDHLDGTDHFGGTDHHHVSRHDNHHVRGLDQHRGVADHRPRHDRRAAAQHRHPSPDRQHRERQHDRHCAARPLGRSTRTADRPAPGQLVHLARGRPEPPVALGQERGRACGHFSDQDRAEEVGRRCAIATG